MLQPSCGQGWRYKDQGMEKSILLFSARFFIFLSWQIEERRNGVCPMNKCHFRLGYYQLSNSLALSQYCQAWLIIQQTYI